MNNVNEYLNDLVNSINQGLGANLSNIPVALVLAIICYFIYKIINKIFSRYSDKLPLDKKVINTINAVIDSLVIFFAIMIIASALGINTSSLIAAFSIFGLAISLAVQNLMSNLANAISIYINKPFKIGDYVSINGIEGTVLDITFMMTKLSSFKNEIIYISNSAVGSATIINYSEHKYRRVEHFIDASYDDDIDKVKYSLRNAVMEEPKVVKTEPVVIYVKDYGSSGITYGIRAYCENKDYLDCSFSLIERYKKNFDKDNITIPYSTINIINK